MHVRHAAMVIYRSGQMRGRENKNRLDRMRYQMSRRAKIGHPDGAYEFQSCRSNQALMLVDCP